MSSPNGSQSSATTLSYLQKCQGFPCAKASLGPFAWEKSSQDSKQREADSAKRQRRTLGARWEGRLSEDILKMPRTRDVFDRIETDPLLSYRLPQAHAAAGVVLYHAGEVFEGLHLTHKPMTFKFGFSHCAHSRWHNPVFGYKYDRDKFQQMVVVYVSDNPVGPAFLEAALIQKYQSCFAFMYSVCFHFLSLSAWNGFCSLHGSFLHIRLAWLQEHKTRRRHCSKCK